MTDEQIKRFCKEKEHELLDKYFGNLVHEAAIERTEIIGEYTIDTKHLALLTNTKKIYYENN